MNIFAAKKTNPKIYQYIHEYSDIEELKESISEIYDNLNKIQFRTKKKVKKKRVIIELYINKNSKKKAVDIITPAFLKIINNKQYICTVVSSKINIKILIELEV
jgi:DNA-directed RNA polymerase alpha subunit